MNSIPFEDKHKKDIDNRYHDFVVDFIFFRLRIAIAIGFFLHLLFLPIYWLIYPATFFEWLRIFSFIVFVLALNLAYIMFFRRFKSFVALAIDAICYSNVVALCAIVFMTDGSASRYYQGINLVFLCYPFVNPFYSRHLIIFFLLSIGFYDLSVIFYHGKFDMTNFIFANYYLSANSIILVFMSKFYSEQHYNAFVRQEQLKISMEEMKEAKEEIERTDIILQKQAEELARSNKELEQFAYIASHDLQEPLRMVASFCQKLEKRYKDKLDADAHEYIHFAVDGAKRMQALVDSLLTYARVGKKVVEIKEVDLNKVLETILSDLDFVIKESGATVNVGKLPVIMANQVQMAQLFQNFLTNALKFKGARKPVIEISARKESTGWEFIISDNGIGIEEQHFSKIFVIFQRLHERDAYPGTGIGLALCKKIIENFNGKIRVESKVGEGTTFFFTLNVKGGDS